MEKKGMILEVRTESGELLCSFRLIVRDELDTAQRKETTPAVKKEGGNGKGNGEKRPLSESGNYEPMTDAQKRYLFRLLAEQGIEKEAAHEELKKTFKVEELKHVTKIEASREIERRLTMQKGGKSDESKPL